MYAPYPENMMESIKKVEATREARMKTEPRRLTAEEKDDLLEKFHPDYNPDSFAEIKVGPNKGQKAPVELAEMLHSTSRLMTDKVDISKIDYSRLLTRRTTLPYSTTSTLSAAVTSRLSPSSLRDLHPRLLMLFSGSTDSV